ncbi:SMI1/KNR4 family protein [Aeoliella sp. SH292]|uniref:SMI1/KNR4 family protein n=1 Tax=Aeoliella sp. SH292 TaxID=3454464 RepID=UPI003F9BD5C8
MNLMDDLAELEKRLTAVVPPAYIHYVQTTPAELLLKQGFDPKTLLVLNMELEVLDPAAVQSDRFFLTGDGCGNDYFIDSRLSPDQVMLWAQDPEGIEDPRLLLSSFLRTEEQMNGIDIYPRLGELCICRTQRCGESILDPITLEEWISAVETTDGVEYRGYRDATNPFTGTTMRIDLPGVAVVHADQKPEEVRHGVGRIVLSDSEPHRELAMVLADKLNAHVLRKSADRTA